MFTRVCQNEKKIGHQHKRLDPRQPMPDRAPVIDHPDVLNRANPPNLRKYDGWIADS